MKKTYVIIIAVGAFIIGGVIAWILIPNWHLCPITCEERANVEARVMALAEEATAYYGPLLEGVERETDKNKSLSHGMTGQFNELVTGPADNCISRVYEENVTKYKVKRKCKTYARKVKRFARYLDDRFPQRAATAERESFKRAIKDFCSDNRFLSKRLFAATS
ncbi:hypothetical protein JXA12_02190 [Candidatus Woesearchaeota archaeon]|nr:hypothetical protein [Candidatus Woesearchaeota archaeon]